MISSGLEILVFNALMLKQFVLSIDLRLTFHVPDVTLPPDIKRLKLLLLNLSSEIFFINSLTNFSSAPSNIHFSFCRC